MSSVLLLLLACGATPAPTTPTVEAPTPAAPLVEPVAVASAPASRVPGAGDTALIAPPDVGDSYSVEVRAGESLDLLARLSGTTPEALAAKNGISVQATLKPGSLLSVPAREGFDAAREAAADARLERYLDNRGGLASVTTREVRTGDTAWAIAREEGIPDWVLAAFNRASRLDRLSVGQTLHVPVVGDSLVGLMEGGSDEGGSDGAGPDEAGAVAEVGSEGVGVTPADASPAEDATALATFEEVEEVEDVEAGR